MNNHSIPYLPFHLIYNLRLQSQKSPIGFRTCCKYIAKVAQW